ncbi:MAG TPA: AAA family ATPase, partial [Acidimicrobiia bacterium]|nr:AAA family ATPase [Acidimicrobiia bacterium]
RQKVALIAALAADVELLVLDEPTSGLDPLMEQVFQQIIRERRAEGVTVFLSSHILGEVEALADRVSIIRKGRNVTTGTLEDLRRHTRTAVHAVTSRTPAALDNMQGVHDLSVSAVDGHVDTRFSADTVALDSAVGLLHASGIQTLTATPPSLDDLFFNEYKNGASS